MESAGPGQRIGHNAGVVTEDAAGDALDALGHFGSRSTRESHQEHATRIGALDDEVRHAVRESVRFARSGARDDKERRTYCSVRPDAMLDRAALFRVQALQVAVGGVGQHESSPCRHNAPSIRARSQ
jgi:hypothetical protein